MRKLTDSINQNTHTMTKKEFYHRLEQVEYLEQVNRRFEALLLAFRRFNEVWNNDSDHGLDLNDYLTTMYPFEKSFDEFLIDFGLWYADGASKIVQAKHEIQPRLSIKEINELTDEVGEPDAEYGSSSSSSWEEIAELRMKEIRRLRAIVQGYENRAETTFIKDIGTEQTGGGVMVDFITFKTLPFVIGLTDDSICLYKSMEHFWGDETGEIGSITIPDTIDVVGEKKPTYGLSDKIDALMTRRANKELKEAIEVMKGLLKPVYYVIKVYGDVEPELSVPSPTEEMRDSVAKQMKALDEQEEGENYSGFYWLNIINGKPEVGSFSGAFFDGVDEVNERRGEYASPQTSMFTIEQMRGTGQLNLLDQIDEVADTKRRLRNQPITYWTDNQHGWFEVSYTDLVILNVHLLISGYSYRNRDEVYLEEDSDIVHFIKAIFGDSYGNDPAFHVWKSQVKEKHEENIFIRKLKHYYR